jgi:hypothetical protein
MMPSDQALFGQRQVGHRAIPSVVRFERRENVLAECLNESQLPPPNLMHRDFVEIHLGVLGEPGSMPSQIRGHQDRMPNVIGPI